MARLTVQRGMALPRVERDWTDFSTVAPAEVGLSMQRSIAMNGRQLSTSEFGTGNDRYSGDSIRYSAISATGSIAFVALPIGPISEWLTFGT